MAAFSKKLTSEIHTVGCTQRDVAHAIGLRFKSALFTGAELPLYAMPLLAGWMELRELDTIGALSLGFVEKGTLPLAYLNKEHQEEVARYYMLLWQQEFNERNNRGMK